MEFLLVDVGIMGVNLFIVEIGFVIFVINEGNGDLIVIILKMYIVIISIEKVVVILEDVDVILEVLVCSVIG